MQKIRKVALYTILLLLATKPILAQSFELQIDKIIDEKGDDPCATFAMAQDSVGFLWFGTIDGLYRYDGYNYKIYRNEKNNPNSLAGNTIRALCMGNNNKLWIGTQGEGLDCFDLTHQKFHHYPFNKFTQNGISGSDIWALIRDRKGNIWVGAVDNGVDMLNIQTGKFRHYNILPVGMIPDDKITIRALFEDRYGTIWIGMVKYGLTALDPQTGKITNYHYGPGNKHSLLSNEIRGIFEDYKGQLWILAYDGGINIYNRETGSFTQYKKSYSDPNSLLSDLVCAGLEDQPGEMWFGTEYGLSIWNVPENQFTNYRHQQILQNSISDNRIRTIFKDKQGGIWIGNETGVDKIVKQHNFKLYKNTPGSQNTLPEGIVRAILEDSDKNLWIAINYQGLVKYNPHTRRYIRYVHNQADPSSIPGNHITSIFQDSHGNLWFGEWDTGLNKYDKKSGTFKLVAGNRAGLPKLTDTRIQFIKEAKPGVLWIGTENGLNLYDTRTRTCSYFYHNENNKNSLSGNALQSNAFVQDSAGNLWLGTWSNGLNRVEFTGRLKKNPIFKHWGYDPSKPDQLNNDNVISLHLDKNGILWIGTFGGGLNRFDLKTEKFKHYTTENGLPNNVIFGILEDDHHDLWLSTDRGLSKFDPKTETFQNYHKADGLQDDHFFWGASFKNNNGELFFGGINGVNSFYPEKIKQDTNVPVPVMTDLKIFETSVHSDLPVWKITKLRLPYNKNYITFEYTALNYLGHGQNMFMVKMEGLDNEWHNNGNRRIASYSNLPPGNYNFRVRAANNDGIWGKKELYLNLIIQPPWWKTWLARSIFIILLIGGVLSFYFIRIGILKSQTRKLEELVTLRTREIQNQKEELKTINEDLSNQKEELSSTLQKLKDTQNQLVESEKMASLGILTAGVAHEINNPLNFIQGGVLGIEAIFEENPGYINNYGLQEELTTLLNGIKTGISRMSLIVTSLNHFNRKTDSLDQQCDIHLIIDNCLLILNNQIKYKIEIIKNYMPETVIVPGNEGKLHQLFLNILINSVHAIDEKGIIEISTREVDQYLRISIKDSGHGISPENLIKIFDPFFTTKEAGKGTGLGLSIAYAIVKDHQGTIEYFSEEGKGTEAIIHLPKNNNVGTIA